MTPLESLIATGTKVWLDSVDPDLIRANRAWGATGATSNPIIISDLVKTGRYDDDLDHLLHEKELGDDEAAWELTDKVVRDAQSVFLPVWKDAKGDNGYVSFELDPLLEDPASPMSQKDRTARYIELKSALAVVLTHAQTVPPRLPTPSQTILSGPDLGFRLDATRDGKAVGTWVVRINGQWVDTAGSLTPKQLSAR